MIIKIYQQMGNICLKMKDIPNEILLHIIQRVSFEDQLRCQKVSKTWRKAAVSCFDDVLILKSDNAVKKISQTLQDAYDNGSDYSGFSNLVKKMVITGEGQLEDSRDKFVSLSEKCPNLQVVDFRDDPPDYFKFMDQSDIVLRDLQFVKISKAFMWREVMNSSLMHRVIFTYLLLMAKLAKSITRIRFQVGGNFSRRLMAPFVIVLQFICFNSHV
jgi:hypothetical protein